MTIFRSSSHSSPANGSRVSLGARALVAISAVAALASSGASAQTGKSATAWVKGNLAQVRLIASHFDGKVLTAGIEIRLKGKAHTYWREPGDGGVPPSFDFSRSENLAKAQVAFPAPIRGGTAEGEFIGYERHVVLPVSIRPVRAGKPVQVRLLLNYAACEKICVPERAVMHLRATPGLSEPRHAATIARYQAAVPRPMSAPDAPELAVKPGRTAMSWTISGAGNGVLRDVFVESEAGWYFITRKTGTAHSLVAVQKPKGARQIPTVRLTVMTASGAFEGAIALP